MSVYVPIIKKENIKKGLLIIDEKDAIYPPVSDKGPGIVSFYDQENGKYKIFFFEQGIETGLLYGDYAFGRIIDEAEAVEFFENKLFPQRKLVKDKQAELNLEKGKLKNSEKAFQSIPALIKKYSV